MSKKLIGSPASYESPVVALVELIERNIDFLVNSCEVVRVLGVNEDKKSLTVIPAVKNVDVDDIAIEETPIYNVKYFGWQFGDCAIQAVPKENDIGIMVISKRDISNINSGVVQSKRKFNQADGIYIGGIVGFNQTPKNFINFDNDGITITTEKDLTVNAKKDVKINAEKQVDVVAPIVNIGDSSGTINIGGEGGVPIAKQGDRVMAGQTVVGTIEQTGGNVNVLQTI